MREHLLIKKRAGKLRSRGHEVARCLQRRRSPKNTHMALIADHHRHRATAGRAVAGVGRGDEPVHRHLSEVGSIDFVLSHASDVFNPAVIEKGHHTQLLPLPGHQRPLDGKHLDPRNLRRLRAARPSPLANPLREQLVGRRPHLDQLATTMRHLSGGLGQQQACFRGDQ